MIRLEDLQEAIAECQGQRSPNANTCLKLASYYTILDHMMKGETKVESVEAIKEIPSYSYDAGTVLYDSDTEFGKTVKGKDESFAWSVMDQLMATLHEMIPKLYTGVINRLNE